MEYLEHSVIKAKYVIAGELAGDAEKYTTNYGYINHQFLIIKKEAKIRNDTEVLNYIIIYLT